MTTRGGGLQAGGLAEATLGVDPDEVDDPSLVPAVGALEEATTSKKKRAHLPTQSSRAGQGMDNKAAVARLEEGRQRLLDRRDKIEADKSGQWLAMAQGMLAPTRTGGFGESLGVTAGLVGAARDKRRKSLTDIETELLDAEVKSQGTAAQARARLAGSEKVYHPDDVADFPDNPEKWRVIKAHEIVHSDGTTETLFSGTEGEGVLQVVTQDNPITVSTTAEAKGDAAAEVKRRSHEIDTGLSATLAVSKLNKAREIFDRVETGGLKDKFALLGQFLNIDIADGTDFMVARRLMGDEVLSQLTLLTGTKTDFEYKKIEELNASTKKGKQANLQIIDDMLERYERIIGIGETAAVDRGDELSTLRYNEYRAGEEERKAFVEQREDANVQPPNTDADTQLIEMFDPNNPTNPQLIEAYKRYYGWPPSDPKVIDALRGKGYTE